MDGWCQLPLHWLDSWQLTITACTCLHESLVRLQSPLSDLITSIGHPMYTLVPMRHDNLTLLSNTYDVYMITSAKLRLHQPYLSIQHLSTRTLQCMVNQGSTPRLDSPLSPFDNLPPPHNTVVTIELYNKESNQQFLQRGRGVVVRVEMIGR